jgi:SAM-dependent methyltransferase
MMKLWYEDEGFWEALEPFFFSYYRTDEVTATGSAVLDLCCGQGRHAVEMVRRGFRVTGVDRTARYLAVARSRVAALGLAAEFVQEDMRRFRRPAGFDLALNLFSSFGFFENAEDDRQVLRNLRDSLRPGGALLMEMLGREAFRRDFRPKELHRLPDNSAVLLEERTVRRDWGWVENRWTLTRGRESRVFRFGLRLYSGDELQAALREAGFARVTLYGSLAGTAYNRAAQRLIAVAAT